MSIDRIYYKKLTVLLLSLSFCNIFAAAFCEKYLF